MSDTSGDKQADDAYAGVPHADDAYTIGAILKGAREANGESIEDVARLLRINWRYLQALEDGRFDELPGTVYAIGFIRTYADYLGVDSVRLVDQYKALGSARNSKSPLVFPEPIPESGLPGGAIMFAGIVVAILAYGGWYLATEENSFLARMVSPVPEQMAGTADQDTTGGGDATVQETTESVIEQPQDVVAEQPSEVPFDASSEVTEGSVPAASEEATVIAEEAAIAEQAAPVSETIAEPSVDVAAESPADVVANEVVPEGNVTEAVPTPSADVTEVAESQPEQAAPEIQTESQETAAVKAVEEAVSPEPVAEPAAEPVVEPAIESVTEPEAVSEPVAEPAVEPVTVTSGETDAQTLNEEQLQAVQEALSSENSAAETTATTPAVSKVVDETVAKVAGTADEPAVGSPATSEENAAQIAATTTSTEEAAVTEAATETSTGRVYGEQGGGRIVVRAKVNSWIQVRDDASGELLLTRMLRAGDEYHVPNREGLSLLTGNAGALEIVVDGTIAPAIGATGDVRRNVALDADRLLAGDAAN